MHRTAQVLLALCVIGALSGVTSASTDTDELPVIVQYQEWFGEYAAILEDTMQLKRTGNSNATLLFNIELLKLLSNATIEMRLADNTTESTIVQADAIGQPCRALMLELFKVFRTIGQAELQACAAHATQELHYWTKQRFFSYANIVHRSATELTHRVALILEKYNKVTEMDSIEQQLSDEYYGFNSYNNALQEVLNRELGRFAPSNHPLRESLADCLNTTVTLHQLDMEYVLSYLDNSCGVLG
uniref:Protein TsetseEP domain-containing protein n=1 Tax=Anopheles dirus TaxID=7168 RepID=A0A182NZ36_9DIPT